MWPRGSTQAQLATIDDRLASIASTLREARGHHEDALIDELTARVRRTPRRPQPGRGPVTYNRPSGASVEELRERAAQAIAREWGISETEARDALERVTAREQRLGTDVARGQIWATFPEPRGQVDLTEPVEVAG